MKRLLFTLGTLIIGILPITVAANMANTTGASEEPPIVQEVRHQGEVLDNHEDRITNNEADIADLQSNTNTAPSPTRVIVREVTTPEPTEPLSTPVEPEPEPIVVTAYEQIPMNTGYNNEDMDCKYTYSDGTTYQWHWKTVEFNQVKITHTNGYCDNRVIGYIKP